METETGETPHNRVQRIRQARRWLRRRLRGRRGRWVTLSGIGLLTLGLCWLALSHGRKPVHSVKPALTIVPTPLIWGPPGIVLHNSDSPARWHGVAVNAARLEDIHAREHPDWATVCGGKTYHIGYHYVILPDGTIEQGRPENCLGTHARTHNDWIGICVIGAFSTNRHWWPERPTAAEIKSVISLCERLMSKYHIPPELVKRHRDINDTYCPGDRFPYFKILGVLKSYAATHPETRPIPGRIVSLARPKRHQHRVYPVGLGATWLPRDPLRLH